MRKGQLVVARSSNKEGKYGIYLVSVEEGCVIESSVDLTEDELRAVLAESYGESQIQIEERIARAKSHPGV